MDLDLPSLPMRPRRQPAADHPVLSLARRATLRLQLRRGARIAVGAGRIWLTEHGDPDDHFIAAGSEHVVRRGGAVVLEGDSEMPARVRVTRS